MNPDHKSPTARPAAPAPGARKPHGAPRRELSLSVEPHKTAVEERSSDPYNTSGSFDRKKNWARVGKR